MNNGLDLVLQKLAQDDVVSLLVGASEMGDALVACGLKVAVLVHPEVQEPLGALPEEMRPLSLKNPKTFWPSYMEAPL